ncbi:MAG: ATP-binding protein [Candidatus Aenigmarchaeota archaeon]|nr:ATP-binding protein [Candidatus Aenigmarchaeota archaeon]
MQEYGTVISTIDSPTTRKFSFVVGKNARVRRGQFVEIAVDDGKLIGRIGDIRKTNRYFINPESVNNVEKNVGMSEAYPTWEWEYLVADVVSLGVYTGKSFQDADFPPSPGDSVREPEKDMLQKFFGFDPDGIDVGSIKHHDVAVSLNMTRLLQKHLAILAMSGAGKSYLTGLILEELLDRQPEKGQIGIVVIDTHGEYAAFSQDKSYSGRSRVFYTSEMQIGLPNLSGGQIAEFTSLNLVQTRELSKYMSRMKGMFSITDIMDAVEEDKKANIKTKEVLLSALESLRKLGIFSSSDYPPLDEICQAGRLTVVDMSDTINLKKKQIVVSYLAKKLFDARRHGIVSPFLLVVEEAHQFAPERTSRERALSKGILQTIAREGRKFHSSLCLISQRPVHLSTTILSQCNSNIILRITNPYDLKHIQESSEGISKDVVDHISSLQVGNALIVGEAVNFPLFVRIRRRKGKESSAGMPLEKAAIEYMNKVRGKVKDAKAFA